MLPTLTPPVSFTPLKQYETCPRSYFWTYVDKRPVLESDLERMFAFGAFFHDRIETAFRVAVELMDAHRTAFPQHPVVFPYSEFRRVMCDVEVPPAFNKRWEEQAPNFLGWVAQMQPFFSLWSLFDSPLVEDAFALGPDWEPVPWDGDRTGPTDGYLIRSFIDLWFGLRPQTMRLGDLTISTPGTAYLFDWKTAVRRYKPVDPETGDVAPQLAVYAASIFARYDWIDRVVATFFNTRCQSPEPAVIIKRQGAVTHGLEWVEALREEVLQNDPFNVHAWEPKKNAFCGICPFFHDCPLARKERFEKARERMLLAMNE